MKQRQPVTCSESTSLYGWKTGRAAFPRHLRVSSVAVTFVLLLTHGVLSATEPTAVTHEVLERILRAQAFNRVFEGFDSYVVTIETDQPQDDGSRDVIAVASGRFLGQEKRLKVEFLVVGDKVIGGQIVEQTDLPPCSSSVRDASL